MSKLLFRSPHLPSVPGRPGPVARPSPRAASLCKAGEADTKFISTLLCQLPDIIHGRNLLTGIPEAARRVPATGWPES